MEGVGSSPRGRGKHLRVSSPYREQGLIPAWAGETAPHRRACAVAGAHPRVGGGNRPGRAAGCIRWGSSPRGRGKQVEQQLADAVAGLIPAWAGETCGWALRQPIVWAHPRVGGGNWRGGSLFGLARGSSPRGRGKQPRHRRPVQHRGLIPAWAGETTNKPALLWPARAHPRVGGGNYSSLNRRAVIPGSSPRGRGKPPDHAGAWRGLGLIPAWAGETPLSIASRRLFRAHPRVGGGNFAHGWMRRAAEGSSPRGRGKPQLPRLVVQGRGLIPAWAGETRSRPALPTWAGAHPRVGGGNPRNQVFDP